MTERPTAPVEAPELEPEAQHAVPRELAVELAKFVVEATKGRANFDAAFRLKGKCERAGLLDEETGDG